MPFIPSYGARLFGFRDAQFAYLQIPATSYILTLRERSDEHLFGRSDGGAAALELVQLTDEAVPTPSILAALEAEGNRVLSAEREPTAVCKVILRVSDLKRRAATETRWRSSKDFALELVMDIESKVAELLPSATAFAMLRDLSERPELTEPECEWGCLPWEGGAMVRVQQDVSTYRVQTPAIDSLLQKAQALVAEELQANGWNDEDARVWHRLRNRRLLGLARELRVRCENILGAVENLEIAKATAADEIAFGHPDQPAVDFLTDLDALVALRDADEDAEHLENLYSGASDMATIYARGNDLLGTWEYQR